MYGFSEKKLKKMLVVSNYCICMVYKKYSRQIKTIFLFTPDTKNNFLNLFSCYDLLKFKGSMN